MKLIFFLALLTPSFASAFAAIAYSDNKDGTWAVFAEWAQTSPTLASQKAIAGCRARAGIDCKIVKTATNGCHAIAITNEGAAAWGLGTADSQIAAQDRSIVKCLLVDPVGSCVVRKSFCDNTCDGSVCPWVQANAFPNDNNPQVMNPGPFYCRSPRDYTACKSATGQGFGTPVDRDRYCKMAFC